MGSQSGENRTVKVIKKPLNNSILKENLTQVSLPKSCTLCYS
jgi:hypothetical protein